VIPGLTDSDLPQVLEAARSAGARFASMQMLRLPPPVEEVFVERLRAALPLRAQRVLHQIEACRDGQLNESRFGQRMRGVGQRWDVIAQLFRATAQRLGYGRAPPIPEPSPFRRPRPGQGVLL
jgi:DNA repair photolyase